LHPNYRPLKIVFELMSPIALSYPWIFFDSLITHLYWRKYSPQLYRWLPSKTVVKKLGDILPHIPLKKYGKIFCASICILDRREEYVVTIYKKFFERKFDYNRARRRKIDRRRGFFRDWRINLISIPCRHIYFYANGIYEEIDSLLSGLPYLGKKGSIGFGFIKKYWIEEIDFDYSVVKNGVAMRPIPIDMLEYTSDIVYMAYRPPYWSKENIDKCAPPNALVRLRENE